jgi:hypothetical protein
MLVLVVSFTRVLKGLRSVGNIHSFLVKPLPVRKTEFLRFDWLFRIFHKGLRSGGWFNLSSTKKALFRCALWVAKTRGQISNKELITQVLNVAYQLLRNFRTRISITGRRRATEMMRTFEQPGGVFSWAPEVREWLHDNDYIIYQGVCAQS